MCAFFDSIVFLVYRAALFSFVPCVFCVDMERLSFPLFAIGELTVTDNTLG